MRSSRSGWRPASKGILLIVLTLTFSFGIVEVVRRCPPLLPLFGVARAARKVVIGERQLAHA